MKNSSILLSLVLGLGVIGLILNVSFDGDNISENEVVHTVHSRVVTDRVPVGASEIAGTDVWTVGTSDAVIVLLPDINGNSPQAQALATSFSQANFTVIIIDYFNGNISNRPPANVSLAYSLSVIQNLYTRGYTDIQAQGYCYGGRVGVSLASRENTIRSCVVAHPASLTNEDASLIIRPMFFEMPSTDGFNSLAPYFNETLLSRNISATFKMYPNTTHGFAVSDTINPAQKAIALQDSINWFVAHRLGGSTTGTTGATGTSGTSGSTGTSGTSGSTGTSSSPTTAAPTNDPSSGATFLTATLATSTISLFYLML